MQEGYFNRIGYIFHADAKADNIEGQEEMNKFQRWKTIEDSRARFRGKKTFAGGESVYFRLLGSTVTKGCFTNTNKPWSALIYWINRIYDSDIWDHIWFIQNQKPHLIIRLFLREKFQNTSKSKTIKYTYNVDYCDLSIL